MADSVLMFGHDGVERYGNEQISKYLAKRDTKKGYVAAQQLFLKK